MKKLAEKIIEKRISILIEEWDFEKRKKTHPEECLCYQQNKKCHDIENLNCLLCFCPYYDTSVKEGKCKINSQSAKYRETSKGKILDCSDCIIPHKKEIVKNILMKILYKI